MEAPTDHWSGCAGTGSAASSSASTSVTGRHWILGGCGRGRSIVVALDVDAFPISDEWLSRLTRPLARGCDGGWRPRGRGARQALARRSAEAGEVETTYTRAASPCAFGTSLPTVTRSAPTGCQFWTSGNAISHRERGHLSFLEPTSHIGPGPVGTVFGDVVYHNFYAARHRHERMERVDGVRTTEAARGMAIARSLGTSPDCRNARLAAAICLVQRSIRRSMRLPRTVRSQWLDCLPDDQGHRPSRPRMAIRGDAAKIVRPAAAACDPATQSWRRTGPVGRGPRG